MAYKLLVVKKNSRRCQLDVLRGQPIKVILVVTTSEFHEYRWNDRVDVFKIIPSKGQYISKAFFLKLPCPKNERNIRQNSTLESKK